MESLLNNHFPSIALFRGIQFNQAFFHSWMAIKGSMCICQKTPHHAAGFGEEVLLGLKAQHLGVGDGQTARPVKPR